MGAGKGNTGKRRAGRGGRTKIKARRAARGEYELVHPPCVQQRALDMEEVRAVLEAGEVDVAEDELRWLLDGCSMFLEAHQLLGRLALARGDVELAHAHLRRAWDLGMAALSRSFSGRLPYARRANRPFLEAGRELVRCLLARGDRDAALEVARRLWSLDPDAPLGVEQLLAEAGPPQ
ncbi:MAG TPA: hypothetical protein EYP56_10320 [Planctomycetaceae bacterium]|nr:hypothetical protein [Planctomycetaceae bacterium]HIQ21093.1 hypothetical protein [Planctomycetota bacterium]